MRVALVVHGWPGEQAGGTGLYVQALAAALAKRGHPVAVVSPRSATAAGTDPPGVTRWPLAAPTPRSFEDSWARPAMLEAWRRFQRAWRPDLVHVHHLSGLPMGLPSAAREGGARVVGCECRIDFSRVHHLAVEHAHAKWRPWRKRGQRCDGRCFIQQRGGRCAK